MPYIYGISYRIFYVFLFVFCRYDESDVPDSMKVHGVYDTSSSMHSFYSREEYKTFLQQQAGMSGSHWGFFAGVKRAWGGSSLSGSEKFMSRYSIDIDRWVINTRIREGRCSFCYVNAHTFCAS